MEKGTQISINFLDHVAIRVKDIQASSKWYAKVLGLKEHKVPEWGDYPVFLLSKKTGVALFPANMNDPLPDPNSTNSKIDHFAFNVDRENFDKAVMLYKDLGLKYNIQDHHYFHSIYTNDPDGHTVELTTLVVEPSEFYKNP